LAVCALLALKIFTGAGKKAAAAVSPAAASNSLGATATALLGAGTGADAANAIRQHIAGQLRQNPEQVRQLFASWLAEER
jgi:membrane protein YqaA with SNARE-associated domain